MNENVLKNLFKILNETTDGVLSLTSGNLKEMNENDIRRLKDIFDILKLVVNKVGEIESEKGLVSDNVLFMAYYYIDEAIDCINIASGYLLDTD